MVYGLLASLKTAPLIFMEILLFYPDSLFKPGFNVRIRGDKPGSLRSGLRC